MSRWMFGIGLRRAVLYGLLALFVTGCDDEGKKAAIRAVNNEFRIDYENILAEKGTRVFKVSRDEAFVAMRVALAQIGMHTESQDSALGHLVVVGPAPLPLVGEEWRKASDADLPLARKIIEPYVGMYASLFHFEPEGLNVVIDATFVKTAAGTEISLTARLREITPPESGWPRREYLSPTVVRAGLDKMWSAFEQELRAGPRRR